MRTGSPEPNESKEMSETPTIDFAGVGALKSGTTWLAACLAEHPDICMADPKELNYFCEKATWPEFPVNRRFGPRWFNERFVHARSGQALGEYSPNYLCDPRAPLLIFRHNPACRLIFCFRHPVEALISFYYQIRKEAPVAATLEEFLSAHPDLRNMGLYYSHVQRFLEVFPREQCLFLVFDDIETNADTMLGQCFSFLGVDSHFVPASLGRRINEGGTPRSQILTSMMNLARHFINKRLPGSTLNWFWKLRLYRLHEWVLQRNLKPTTRMPVRETTRTQLLDFYREDTRALARFLKRDLSNWER